MTRQTTSAILQGMDVLEQRINEGKLRVDDEGNIVSEQADGSFVVIGHEDGSSRANRRITYRDKEGKPASIQCQRLAWRIHRGEWPPEDMSVMMINGNKGDFRIQNLALVYRGQENRLKVALHGPAKRPRKKAS